MNLQVHIPKYVSCGWVDTPCSREYVTLTLTLIASPHCRNLTPRQQELMQEFLQEEEAKAATGDSDCKSHTFLETARETVDRIKSFFKSKTAEKPEASS